MTQILGYAEKVVLTSNFEKKTRKKLQNFWMGNFFDIKYIGNAKTLDFECFVYRIVPLILPYPKHSSIS